MILVSTVFGYFSGIIPGLHVNTLIPLLMKTNFDALILSSIIISFSISQVFSDYLTSVYFGVPDVSNPLNVLPAHRLTLKGRGYEAFRLSILGVMFSIVLTILFSFLIMPVFPNFYAHVRKYVFYLILFVVFYTILTEGSKSKMMVASIVFLLSGIMGIVVENSPILPRNEALLPMLTGFFGLSQIFLSIFEKSKIPKQRIDEKIYMSKISLIKAIVIGSIAGITAGFLPGIGVSQSVMLFSPFIPNTREFLVATASVNGANEVFSFSSLYLVGNPRSGAGVAVKQLLDNMNMYDFLFLISVMLISSSVSLFISLKVGKIFPKIVSRINYRKLNITIGILLFAIIYLFTNIYGLVVLLSSTFMGIFAVKNGVKRVHMMGCLLLPTLLFFSGYYYNVLSLLFP